MRRLIIEVKASQIVQWHIALIDSQNCPLPIMNSQEGIENSASALSRLFSISKTS